MPISVSLGLFVLAGLCEIGGGYLVWLWLREGKGLGFAVVGAAILILYGIIPTLQPTHFGRVYAAYGGMFIVLSLLWGWAADGNQPDKYDAFGAMVCLTVSLGRHVYGCTDERSGEQDVRLPRLRRGLILRENCQHR